MKSLIVLCLGFCLCVSGDQLFAADKVWSYTMEEMYEMASYFRQMRDGKQLDNTIAYLKAAEFKGYVAAVLDSTDHYDDCAKENRVNDIAGRTAILITSAPLDRSALAAVVVRVCISYACDESTWAEEK